MKLHALQALIAAVEEGSLRAAARRVGVSQPALTKTVRELEREGMIPGAFHAPRGMLEFWVDPDSPYFKPVFGEDKEFIFFCAGGMRSVLATKVAQDMGLKPVAHVIGGFGAWKTSGGPVEPGEPRK